MNGRNAQQVKRWVEHERSEDPLSLSLERPGEGEAGRLALKRVIWRGTEWFTGHNAVVVRPGLSERAPFYLEECVREAAEGGAGYPRSSPADGPHTEPSLDAERHAFSVARLLQVRRVDGPFEERRLIWMIDGACVAFFDLLRCRAAGEYTVGVRWETPIAEAETNRSMRGWTLDGNRARLTLAFPHEGWFAAEGMEHPSSSGQVLYQVMARRFREGLPWSVGNLLLPHRGGLSRAERVPAFDQGGRKAYPRALALAARIADCTYTFGARSGAGRFTFGRGALATDADTFVWWREGARARSHFLFAGGEMLRVAGHAPPRGVRLRRPASVEGRSLDEVRLLTRGTDWSMEEDGLAVRWKVPAGHIEIHDDLEA